MRYMYSFQDSWPALFKVITWYAFRIHESCLNFMKIFNRYDRNFVTSDSIKDLKVLPMKIQKQNSCLIQTLSLKVSPRKLIF